MPSPPFSILSHWVENEWQRLNRNQITPWAFFAAGPPFRCTDFYGHQISYQGITFDGSPRDVFWGRYVEPFLEDIILRSVEEALQLASSRGLAPNQSLLELADLLKSLTRRTYQRMTDIDRRLRGKGYPESVALRNVKPEIDAMERFIKERIQSETAILTSARRETTDGGDSPVNPLREVQMAQVTCIFCGLQVDGSERDYGDKCLFRCPICRPYEISRTAMAMVAARHEREPTFRPSMISPLIRRIDRDGTKPALIHSDVVRQLLNRTVVPSHQEQADNMIQYLGDRLADNPAGVVHHAKQQWAAVVGSPETGGGSYIARELRERGLITMDATLDGIRAGLTFDGWDRYQNIAGVRTTQAPEQAPMTAAPKVFVSYSHDGDDHMAWVLSLANDLSLNGIDVDIDRWSVSLGDDLARFMERGVVAADRVIVVCTPSYVTKANAGKGGVGYEKMIVTAELVRDQGTKKFIPLVRGSGGSKQVPTFLQTRLYIDFDDDASYKKRLRDLLADLHNVQRKPPIGSNPFQSRGD